MVVRCATMLSLLVGTSAHVSMVYLDGQVGSIRNANSATGNGGASVNSPCGGATTFGSNGIGLAQDGETVTLSMRYAAGHNGAFRMAFACGAGDGSALEAGAATLTAADDACTVTGAASDYGAGTGGGATAIGQDAMSITCTLPAQNNAAPVDCIIGILDQRDWGGCVDISLASAADPLPPSPPPAPFGAAGECSNTCVGQPEYASLYASDGICDDGGPGAQYGDCALGTDCTDCGTSACVSPRLTGA